MDLSTIPPDHRRIEYIDSLRCIAATAVLLQHLLEVVGPERFSAILDCGPGVFGVSLFFFISGFVIPLSVQRRPPVAAFLVRRVFRIYPAYLAVLALVALQAVLSGQQSPFARIGFAATVANLLLVYEYFKMPGLLGVTWTLSLELAWYALFALAFYRFPQRSAVRMLLVYSVGLFLLAMLSLAFELRFPLGRLGLIGAAILGYATWDHRAGRSSSREYLLACSAFVVINTLSLYTAFGVFHHPKIQLHHSLIAWTTSTALFIFTSNVKHRILIRCLEFPATVFIGKASYSLYLLHGLCIAASIRFAGSELSLYIVPPAAIAAAALSFKFVELPGVALGKQLEHAILARRYPLDRASA